MTATVILVILGLIIYSVFQYWEYINPYVDEPVGRTGVYDKANDDLPLYRETKYKRTWKNGKVEYIIKRDRT